MVICGRRRRPCGVVDPIEMSDVAAFLAVDTTDVFSAAKAADDNFCPATRPGFAMVLEARGSKWDFDCIASQLLSRLIC